MRLFMLLHAALYRLTKGRLGGVIGGNPLLLLHVTGRRTGKHYTIPLMFIRDGDAFVVIASAMGAPKHPAWFLNLLAQPRTTVQVRGTTVAVEASEAQGEERRRLWQRLRAPAPFLDRHEQKAGRAIPVVVLRPV